MISSIYSRGIHSRAHYTSFRSSTKNGVPKNIRKDSKVVRINRWAYMNMGTLCVDDLLTLLK